ncbi:MAG: glycosyltransferase family 9 protein [Verrucomicrobia bacterium]|nr:glycosyltransferase family 9 protein [Verrucomicrobiota bacterium]
MPSKKLILESHLSPGDVVMLTAALRDIHACNPGKFLTDVRTSARALWDHNPHITPLKEDDAGVEVIKCHYPLIHRSNQTPFHFIHGFEQFLSERLNVPVSPAAFKGDIHLSGEEKAQPSQVQTLIGEDLPFWIIVAGGKNDYTIKWWNTERYQAVVNHFKEKILFVQVGEKGHNHSPLEGVLDLRGKTTIRQLLKLVYHAQGVLSPVTFLMHLAAAVETKPGTPACRPCVVVAGGREPVHWEAYPHHQFLHTQGALSCCQIGGCWRSRTLPLGDGDPKDKPQNRCVDVIGDLPHCMDMITPKKVNAAIETYFDGGLITYLEKGKAKNIDFVAASKRVIKSNSPNGKTNNNRMNRNRVTLRFLGMRRSGIHPILNWLAGLYEGKVCFVNDINHQHRILANHPSDPLPAVDASFNQEARLDENKNLLLLSYEDMRLVNLENPSMEAELYGQSGKLHDILNLRDPFNTFASRLHLQRKQPKNAFVKDFLLPDENGTPLLPRRWKFLAQEYLGQTNHLKNGKLVINFNQWVVDENYRKQLCETLDVPFRDEHREQVPEYGFGSSFDKRRYNKRGSSMKLTQRWEHFRDDPEFLSFFSDPEILQLSETIFGDVLDHAPIRAALENAPSAQKVAPVA